MDLPYSTSRKDQPVKIRYGEGNAGTAAKTIFENFDGAIAQFGDKPALHVSHFCKCPVKTL